MPRRILVTSALPYANGHIHIGHLVEYLQTDIWARFQRLRGERCLYLCADDTHGTAIMIRAQKEGRSELELIESMSRAHQRDFAGFQIQFDHYGSTHSEANRKLCVSIWQALREKGLVSERDVTQLFDPKTGIFLADRFVKGNCPRCGAPDQYGDSCEKCGSAYSASDLKNPVSVLSGATPEVRTAKHLFVEIEKLHDFLNQWTQGGDHLQTEIANYLKGHFLSEPLRDWDVSRPAPYFGFEIPDAPGHYWYVWYDAPIGYIAASDEWCAAHGENLDDWWRSDEVEIFHFIGKDISYFHTLFWPAMLKSAGLSLPRRVQVHGFLTVNGEKMSKSRGTFVMASTYLDHLDPAYLRYYYAAKLGPKVDDLDLNLEEFVAKVNADLVGKVVNLASRCARFVRSTGLSPAYPNDGGLFQAAATLGDEIADAFDGCDLAKAMRLTMSLADRANQYVDSVEPWKLAKDKGRAEELQSVCTVALNLYWQLVVYLSPVLPQLAEQTAELLGQRVSHWDNAKRPLLGGPVGDFKHLLSRVDAKKVQAMISASFAGDAPAPAAAPARVEARSEALLPLCSIDDFNRIDLRIARITQAEDVPGARKLIRLTVSLGDLGERTVFAGIKSAYAPESLIGKMVVVVANLTPRPMQFGLSEGMLLVAGDGSSLFLISPDAGASPGQRVR
ncbi:MAG TPA: methionine--tRNA ligase [Polyangiaceae bacterium]|jgi:methionyl-tRNA synthetase